MSEYLFVRPTNEVLEQLTKKRFFSSEHSQNEIITALIWIVLSYLFQPLYGLCIFVLCLSSNLSIWSSFLWLDGWVLHFDHISRRMFVVFETVSNWTCLVCCCVSMRKLCPCDNVAERNLLGFRHALMAMRTHIQESSFCEFSSCI